MMVTDIGRFYLHANCPSFPVIYLKTNALCSEKIKNILYFFICQGERVSIHETRTLYHADEARQCLLSVSRLQTWPVINFLERIHFFDAI